MESQLLSCGNRNDVIKRDLGKGLEEVGANDQKRHPSAGNMGAKLVIYLSSYTSLIFFSNSFTQIYT